VPVDPVQIKSLGVEHAANPAHHVLVLLVPTLAERPEELRVAVRAADVLGWAGILPGDTDWKGELAGRRERCGLDDDPMYPAVPHVVAILEFSPRPKLRHDDSDRDSTFVSIAVGFLLRPSLPDPPVWRNQARSDLEFMRVGVRPAHHPLQIVMQGRKRPIVRDEHPPPDERRDLLEFDAQCDGFGQRWFWHSLSFVPIRGATTRRWATLGIHQLLSRC